MTTAARSVALLPMYDWPEVRHETDALWDAIATACRCRDMDPPDVLTRPDDYRDGWLEPDLFLAQTCGLPFARDLRGKVALIGSPVYALDDECPPGDYYSVVIARRGGPTTSADLIEAHHRFAFNSLCSQSGFRAACQTFASHPGFPESVSEHLAKGYRTGSHRESIRAVATDQADFATIDAVSWRLARQHEELARDVQPIGHTAPTPGLPIIAAPVMPVALLADALSDALARLAPGLAKALGIVGFRPRPERDYDVFDAA